MPLTINPKVNGKNEQKISEKRKKMGKTEQKKLT
jgi:hypothetical protein